MNRIGNSNRSNDAPESLDREIRELLQKAGPRPKVPDEHFSKIKRAARAEWQEMVRAQGTSNSVGRRSLPAGALAAAALLVMALGVGWWWTSRPGPAALRTVASIERVRGEARGDGQVLEQGFSLVEGAELSTRTGASAPSLLAVRLSNGHSVRLDSDSRVRLVSGAALELLAGAVYVDSGADRADGAARSVEVMTPFGAVRDIGTQFEVRLQNGDAAGLRVRVREGKVSLRHAAETHSAEAGQEMTVDGTGAVEVGVVSRHGEEWSWAIAAAPGLEIEGLSLARYLDWLTRETGIEVRYSDSVDAGAAGEIELFGSIEGLSAFESVDVVLPSTGLDYRLAGHDLMIGAWPGD